MRRTLLGIALACVLSPELDILIRQLEETTNSGAFITLGGVDTNRALLTLAREIAKQECEKQK